MTNTSHLKPFNELYKLDISADVKKKPTFKKEGDRYVKMSEKYWLDYLEWATVITLLHQNGASSVTFGSHKNSEGYPAFYNNNGSPFVAVWVKIDNMHFEIEYPVIDGNKVEKDPDQLSIHKAQQRAFVKCVAINTGLGLKLWQKEETNFDNIEKEKTKPPFPSDNEKFNKTVAWLKAGNTIEKLEEVYTIDEDTKFNLTAASES